MGCDYTCQKVYTVTYVSGKTFDSYPDGEYRERYYVDSYDELEETYTDALDREIETTEHLGYKLIYSEKKWLIKNMEMIDSVCAVTGVDKNNMTDILTIERIVRCFPN
jgi:hypothetical protein